MTMERQLEIRGLCKTYTQVHGWQRGHQVPALQGIDLGLNAGTTLALVGESGSGKTTLAMCLVGLDEPDAGDIRSEGRSVMPLSAQERKAVRRDIQLIFQDSAGALNPRMSAAQLIEEPLVIQGDIHREERSGLSSAVMEQVGLPSNWKSRKPYQLSGGQRQRLAIARALILRPKLLILDEALTGLDLSIQGQIANLLSDLQAAYGLSYIHISHNLALVSRIADEIAVIHQGRVVAWPKPSEILTPPSATCLMPTIPRNAERAHGAGGRMV